MTSACLKSYETICNMLFGQIWTQAIIRLIYNMIFGIFWYSSQNQAYQAVGIVTWIMYGGLNVKIGARNDICMSENLLNDMLYDIWANLIFKPKLGLAGSRQFWLELVPGAKT